MGKDLEVLISKLEDTAFYPGLFEAAFDDEAITSDRIAEALAQFVKSLNVFDSKYDQVKDGQASFTEAELIGEELFNENCLTCHSSHQFSILKPLSNTLTTTDPGWAEVTGDELDLGKFKTPSLRNIELTAPYMHDGRFQTLEEVAIFYSDSIPNFSYYYNPNTGQTFNIGQIDFDDTDINNLTAFLQTLTSNGLTTLEKFSDPFQNPNAVKPQSLEETFVIYPNPFNDKTTIQFENPNQERYVFHLKNSQGQTVLSFSTNEAGAVLERNGLPIGVYFLEIKKGDRFRIDKIVIK